jgi:putative addiction module component (TIGR02574 family)
VAYAIATGIINRQDVPEDLLGHLALRLEFYALTPSELAELLWTSIAQIPETVLITAAQRAERDRRLDDAERDARGASSVRSATAPTWWLRPRAVPARTRR